MARYNIEEEMGKRVAMLEKLAEIIPEVSLSIGIAKKISIPQLVIDKSEEMADKILGREATIAEIDMISSVLATTYASVNAIHDNPGKAQVEVFRMCGVSVSDDEANEIESCMKALVSSVVSDSVDVIDGYLNSDSSE